MPLNGELKAPGGHLLEATTISDDYRLYALPKSTPAKPGLIRVPAGQAWRSSSRSGRYPPMA